MSPLEAEDKYNLTIEDIRREASLGIKLVCSSQFTLITGPERGFSNKELSLLHQKASGVKLSHSILRAETAPIAGIRIFIYVID